MAPHKDAGTWWFDAARGDAAGYFGSVTSSRARARDRVRKPALPAFGRPRPGASIPLQPVDFLPTTFGPPPYDGASGNLGTVAGIPDLLDRRKGA